MSESGMLSAWGVVLDADIGADASPAEGASRCLQLGREAYTERCPRLTAFVEREGATLEARGPNIASVHPPPIDGRVQVAVSATEIRPTSFDLAIRLRWLASRGPMIIDGRVTLSIVDAGGVAIPIPTDIRDELIAIQLAARDLA